MAPSDTDDEPRPWEQPGALRRDCEPHRGPVLRFLGRTGFILAGLGLLLDVPVALLGRWGPQEMFVAATAANLLGLGLSGAAWGRASRDLVRMGKGLMDPSGREASEVGRVYGFLGVVLAFQSLVVLLILSSSIR
jgi:hypothetical protein